MLSTPSTPPFTSSPNKLLITNDAILRMKPGDTPFVGYVLINENGKSVRVGAGDPPLNYALFDAGVHAEALILVPMQ